MTGTDRKRISKWDLKEGPHLVRGVHNDGGSGRPSSREQQPRWRHGDGNYKQSRESVDASDIWDGEATYGTRMSPGLDEWRQIMNRSPESGRGRSYRSRSRSPERGFKHQDYKYAEDRKYPGSGLADSWEGRPRRNDASKYLASDDTRERNSRTERSVDVSRRSANEVLRERESDRRDRVTSSEYNRNHDSRRSSDIVCKFFASGNCRNGKSCRFSHHVQTRDSSDSRTRSDWRQGSSSLNRMDSLKEGSRWSGTAVSDVANFSMWSEDRSGGFGAPEQRSIPRSTGDNHATDDRFMVHRTDNDIATGNSERGYLSFAADNTVSGIGLADSRNAVIQDADMEISPPLDRLPSSNHIVKEEFRQASEPSKYSLQDKVALKSFQQDTVHDVNQKQSFPVMQPWNSQTPYVHQNPSLDNGALNGFSRENRNSISDDDLPDIDLNFSASAYVPSAEHLGQNGQGSTTVSQPLSGLNTVDQNQQVYGKYAPEHESLAYSGIPQPPQEGTSSRPDVLDTVKSDVISDNPLARKIVSSEQFSNLTVSLARLLECGKQLPDLYAALNGSNSTGVVLPSLSNSAVPAAFPPTVSVQQNSVVGSQKQYNLPQMPAQLRPSFPVGPSGLDLLRTDNKNVELNVNNHQLSREEQAGNVLENNTIKVEERINEQDNGAAENIARDGKADENKKSNDAKVLRAFKFALADFVKELLKPKWKESQINKETYKTIVKKVVDKVTGTQKGNIPQSQEKIESFLSSAKPKLSKLVEAYVEKTQKEKPSET